MRAIQSNLNTFIYAPNKYFSIPIFQRPYSWDLENIREFLDDIEKVITTNQNHYFGSIVYIAGNESVIIDGQQRATTALLMITAIYHIIKKNSIKANIPAEQINEQFLFNKYGEEKNRLKLKTVISDNEIFENIYKQSIKTEDQKASKLFKAYSFFYEYFDNKTNLHNYINALERFEIVDISIDNTDDNPQKIFESINSTGKPLTDGDKIRNFALMLNNKKNMEYVYEEYWQIIEKRLTRISQEYISDFFKNYLTSYLQREFKLDQVYPGFKKEFEKNIEENHDNKDSIDKFYIHIIDYLDAYEAFKFNVYTVDKYKIFKDQIFRINYLNFEVVYPFLMRVLLRYSNDELSQNQVKEILNLVESYLTRRIISGIPSSGLNKFFAVLDKEVIEIFESEKLDFDDYINILNYLFIDKTQALRFPDDAEIKNSISTNKFYLQRKSNVLFVLSSIDDKHQSKESYVLEKITSPDNNLTIEHIMPQTLNSDWREELGLNYQVLYEQYLHTLPNLTITGYNPKYSNRSFNIKKTIENGFSDSPLLINKYINKSDLWDENALKQRAKWWLKQICIIWPNPKSDYIPPKTDRVVDILKVDNLKGERIKSITIFGDTYNVSTWAEALDTVAEQLIERNEHWRDIITRNEQLSKYITSNNKNLLSGYELGDTGYYIETGTSTNRKLNLIHNIVESLEFKNLEITAELLPPLKPEDE